MPRRGRGHKDAHGRQRDNRAGDSSRARDSRNRRAGVYRRANRGNARRRTLPQVARYKSCGAFHSRHQTAHSERAHGVRRGGCRNWRRNKRRARDKERRYRHIHGHYGH